MSKSEKKFNRLAVRMLKDLSEGLIPLTEEDSFYIDGLGWSMTVMRDDMQPLMDAGYVILDRGNSLAITPEGRKFIKGEFE